jgi:hypothetical protein
MSVLLVHQIRDEVARDKEIFDFECTPLNCTVSEGVEERGETKA